MRARLVCREFHWTQLRDDLYCPGASFSTGRLVDALALKYDWSSFTLDGTNAFLHCPEPDTVTVDPPAVWLEEEAKAGRSTRVLWHMLATLYGRRIAPQRWSKWFAGMLCECGLKRCLPAPQFFAGDAMEVKTMFVEVHMDDLHGTGEDSHREELIKRIKTRLACKFAVFDRWVSRCTHLRRERLRTESGTWIVPNARYLNGVVMALGLEQAKATPTPSTAVAPQEGDDELLDEKGIKLYRSCVGSLLYYTQDRRDVQFDVNVLTTKFQQPTAGSMRHLRRLTRYLKGTANYAVELVKPPTALGARAEKVELVVWSDSDWAAERGRHSQSSMYMELDGMAMGGSSRRQGAIATSSTEAEWYAMAGALSEALLVKHILEFANLVVKLELRADSSSARQLAKKEGVARIKHLQVKTLWIQEQVGKKLVAITPVATDVNKADLGTKRLDAKKLQGMREMAHIRPIPLELIKSFGIVALASMIPPATAERDTAEDSPSSILFVSWVLVSLVSAFFVAGQMGKQLLTGWQRKEVSQVSRRDQGSQTRNTCVSIGVQAGPSRKEAEAEAAREAAREEKVKPTVVTVLRRPVEFFVTSHTSEVIHTSRCQAVRASRRFDRKRLCRYCMDEEPALSG